MSDELQVLCLLGAVLGAIGAARFLRPERLQVAVPLGLIGLITVTSIAGTVLRPKQIPEADVQGRPIEVDADGYIGSEACRACHTREHQTWDDSYHSSMTQKAGPDTVLGDFDNVTLQADGKDYKLERVGDEYWVDQPDPFAYLNDKSRPERLRSKIVMTTGSHNMQAYWFETGHTRNVGMLPFTWHIEDQAWQTRRSAFIAPESDPHVTRMGDWNIICLKCHATHSRPRIMTEGNVQTGAFTEIAEFGISCESCHGPGAAHVAANQNPLRRYAQRLSDEPDPTIVNPANLDPMKSTQVCGSCHADLEYDFDERTLHEWFRDGFKFRPGDDLRKYYRPDFSGEDQFWSDGLIRTAGREYNSLLHSDCHEKGGMSCLTCHKMHQDTDDPRPSKEWAADQLHPMDINQTCLDCHSEYAKDVPAHTHHAADSIGSNCMNCHMPHSTYGLMKGVRTHRIESPSVQVTLQTKRPNACNLCHLDQTLEWTANNLNAWYGTEVPDLEKDDREIAASVRWALHGDAGLRALIAWNYSNGPAKDTSGSDWMPPYLAQLLVDPYEAVRIIAQRSLRKMPGYEGMSHDLIGTKEQREAAKVEALEIWQKQGAGSKVANDRRTRVLVDKDGQVIKGAFERLLKLRNDKLVRLHE